MSECKGSNSLATRWIQVRSFKRVRDGGCNEGFSPTAATRTSCNGAQVSGGKGRHTSSLATRVVQIRCFMGVRTGHDSDTLIVQRSSDASVHSETTAPPFRKTSINGCPRKKEKPPALPPRQRNVRCAPNRGRHRVTAE